ncbi:MAG: MerR family transcriptional regulator [Alphaproteobacteria bacterium]|nr:MerR family transcriptional regulator [Alphaproteobacteria bacterium]MBN2779911.1 MerR family transcriptional regulator [Alphaproteobacteria bacterium]
MSEKLFKSIGEVSKELDVATHILRFWEENFKSIRPVRRNGGRRYYHTRDVELLYKIKDLLYKKGYTIKGAQKFLRQEAFQTTSREDPSDLRTTTVVSTKPTYPDLRGTLSSVLSDLKALKTILTEV